MRRKFFSRMINVLISAIATVFLVILGGFFREAPRLRLGLALLGALITLFFAVELGIATFSKQSLGGVVTVPFGILHLNFGADVYSVVFALLVCTLWPIASIYSFTYLRHNYPEKSDSLFQICYALAVFLAVCFAFAKDLITMFVIYEFLTLSTIVLVGWKRNEESRLGLRKYLVILLFGSFCLLLPAILYIVNELGTQIFNGEGFLIGLNAEGTAYRILLLMLVFGAAKAAIFGVHAWLPAAMCAPTPVSGLLHAVAIVKVGAFFIFRVVHDVFGISFLSALMNDFNILLYLSGFTLLFASTTATRQKNLKKRLAYSTIAQISYIIFAISTFTPLGMFAGMMQILSHAMSKILLFFTVGGFYTAAHSNNIVDFTGIGRKYKTLGVAFVFGSLALCGFPLTFGFLNKLVLFYNFAQNENYYGMVVLMFSSFLAFAYLMPVCYSIFKEVPAEKIAKFYEIPQNFNVVFVLLMTLNIAMFVAGSVFIFGGYVNEW